MLIAQGSLLDLFLQGGLEELEQKVLLPLVGGIVVQGEDDGVHELGGLVLWHLEDQLGQVGRVCLEKGRNNTSCLRLISCFPVISHASLIPDRFCRLYR